MTIPRVLMAAALLVLGFMIWGVHKDVWALRGALEKGTGQIIAQLGGLGSQLTGAHDKLDTLHAKVDKLKPTGRIIVGRPRVKPVPHLPPHELTIFERIFGIQPVPTVGTPVPPAKKRHRAVSTEYTPPSY